MDRFFLGLLLASTAGCSGPRGEDATSGETGEPDLEGLYCSEQKMDDQPWLQPGQGLAEFEPFSDGSEWRIVLGGQGFFMFPLSLRAGGFCVPEDLSDRDEFPIIDVDVLVEDQRVAKLFNQPLDFIVQDDDTYALMALPLILDDDGPQPADLVGKSGRLEIQLEPYAVDPIVVEIDFVVGLEN